MLFIMWITPTLAFSATDCLHNCSGNGACVAGICNCNVDKNGFGYKGDDCSIPCGSHTFSGQGNNRNCLYAPGTNSLLDADDSEADCFCRKTTGFGNDARMHKADWSTHKQTFASDSTFRCTDGSRACHMSPFHDCTEVNWIRCQFGNDPSCA